jgi:hypothetical protein
VLWSTMNRWTVPTSRTCTLVVVLAYGNAKLQSLGAGDDTSISSFEVSDNC